VRAPRYFGTLFEKLDLALSYFFSGHTLISLNDITATLS
jgi:hypothetical protein